MPLANSMELLLGTELLIQLELVLDVLTTSMASRKVQRVSLGLLVSPSLLTVNVAAMDGNATAWLSAIVNALLVNVFNGGMAIPFLLPNGFGVLLFFQPLFRPI